MADKSLIESKVPFEIRIDASDIVSGLEGNDELILQFICQVIALAHSSELRQQLADRLGATIVDDATWQDEEYVE